MNVSWGTERVYSWGCWKPTSLAYSKRLRTSGALQPMEPTTCHALLKVGPAPGPHTMSPTRRHSLLAGSGRRECTTSQARSRTDWGARVSWSLLLIYGGLIIIQNCLDWFYFFWSKVRVTHQKENIMLVICSHLYIDSGRWYLCHVPSTFATVNTHANVFFVFLPGGISKEWRHIVSAICDF